MAEPKIVVSDLGLWADYLWPHMKLSVKPAVVLSVLSAFSGHQRLLQDPHFVEWDDQHD